MFSVPLICSSSGEATVSAITLGLAPGNCAFTTTVGGTTSGYSEIGNWSGVALGVDFTSPTANASETGLDFINSDVTLYLHRLPVGEWVGYEVADHQSAEGIAVGHCRLHDRHGPIGFSSCAALAQSRR